MNIQIDSQILGREDASAYYDENKKICYLGSRTALECGCSAQGMDPNLGQFICIINHEILHDILNLHHGKTVSLNLDNVAWGSGLYWI